MNLKKKLKKLLAFDRCSEGGFTLVELVVVIAILGILGGVGTVGYSGYVKKANIAADEALLREVNTAFAAACVANGENYIGRDTNTKLTKSIEFTDDSQKVQESFYDFFEGAEGSEFKTMERFWYEAALGVFTGYEPVFTDKADFSGLNAYKEFYQGGSYKNSGIAVLSGTVDNLTSLLAGDNGLNTLKGFDNFKKTLDALGLSVDDDAQTLANAAVVYAAQNLSNVDAKDFMDAFVEDEGAFGQNVDNYLKDAFDTTDPVELNLLKAALQYGMAQSYVDSLLPGETFDIPTETPGVTIEMDAKEWFTKNPPTGVVEVEKIMGIVMEDAYGAFAEYIAYDDEDRGRNDLSLFLGMMGVIDQNVDKGGFGSLEGSGLYSSDEVQKILNQYLGN